MLAVFGPTAAGKSAVIHAAARELGGEIIVADPFQRYRGLEVAADAPSPRERGEVPYHLVGDLELGASSTAADFARRADEAIRAIIDRGAVPIVAGGTALYLRAALHDLDFPPPPDPEVRERIEREVSEDLAAAAARLRSADPEGAESIDSANPRRVARALEALESATGRGVGLWEAPPRRPYLLVAVTRPRSEVDRRIASRVAREISDGLVAEIETALQHPGGLSREAAQIIGVREVMAINAGELDAEDLPERLTARTRRLARKQDTWLRRMEPDATLDLGSSPASASGPRLAAIWREAVE